MYSYNPPPTKKKCGGAVKKRNKCNFHFPVTDIFFLIEYGKIYKCICSIQGILGVHINNSLLYQEHTELRNYTYQLILPYKKA